MRRRDGASAWGRPGFAVCGLAPSGRAVRALLHSGHVLRGLEACANSPRLIARGQAKAFANG